MQVFTFRFMVLVITRERERAQWPPETFVYQSYSAVIGLHKVREKSFI